MTTYQEVSRCPKCDQPGKPTKGGRLAGAPRGSSSIKFTCENERCRWNTTSWMVQVREDGTFPPAVTRRPKNYPALPHNSSIVESLETLQELTTQPGAEIRR